MVCHVLSFKKIIGEITIHKGVCKRLLQVFLVTNTSGIGLLRDAGMLHEIPLF